MQSPTAPIALEPDRESSATQVSPDQVQPAHRGQSPDVLAVSPKHVALDEEVRLAPSTRAFGACKANVDQPDRLFLRPPRGASDPGRSDAKVRAKEIPRRPRNAIVGPVTTSLAAATPGAAQAGDPAASAIIGPELADGEVVLWCARPVPPRSPRSGSGRWR